MVRRVLRGTLSPEGDRGRLLDASEGVTPSMEVGGDPVPSGWGEAGRELSLGGGARAWRARERIFWICWE